MNEATTHLRAAPPPVREISIPGLVQTTWRGLWLLLAVVILCVLVTAIGLRMRPPVYTATMIVAPAQTDLSGASQLASEIEEFASLATLAQTPAKVEHVSNLERYAQLFGSTALAARLQAEHKLLQTVFAGQWDAEHQTWHPPRGALARVKGAVLRFFSYPAWTEPDLDSLAEWLGDQIDVERIGQSSIFRISMTHPRPQFAVSVIEMAHRAADALLREEAQDRIGRQIGEVESEIASVTSPSHKQALEQMLAEQYQAQALLRVNQPYAAQILVPASAGGAPSSLNPLLTLELAAVVGVILGLFAVFLRDALRSEPR